MSRRQPIPTNTPGGTPMWVIWLGVIGGLVLCCLLCYGPFLLAVVVMGL